MRLSFALWEKQTQTMSWILNPNKNIVIYFCLVPWMEDCRVRPTNRNAIGSEQSGGQPFSRSTSGYFDVTQMWNVVQGWTVQATFRQSSMFFWQRELFLRKRVSGLNHLDIFQRGMTRCVWTTQQWKTTTLHQGMPQQVYLYKRLCFGCPNVRYWYTWSSSFIKNINQKDIFY